MTPEEYQKMYAAERAKEEAGRAALEWKNKETARRLSEGLKVWIPLKTAHKLCGNLPLHYSEWGEVVIFYPKDKSYLFAKTGDIDKLSDALKPNGEHLEKFENGWRVAFLPKK